MLGQLESHGSEFVIADMEAGSGSLTRMAADSLDLALIVAEPSSKSIEVARRSAEIIAERMIAPILIVANRVRDAGDEQMVSARLAGAEVHRVPDDDAVRAADRDGVSLFDSDPGSPASQAIRTLSLRLRSQPRGEQSLKPVTDQVQPQR